MRKLGITTLALLALAIASSAVAQKQQSVAEAARENKKQKPESAQKVWTNDNITTVSKGLATEGASAATSETPNADSAEAKQECDKSKDEKCEPKEAKEVKDCDKTKDENCEAAAKPAGAETADKSAELKKKLAEMEKALADQKHEASVNEREWQLSQAAFYGDAGTQLRDPKRFSDAQASHQKDAERLQKSIDDLQKKIDDLKEQARKDGTKL